MARQVKKNENGLDALYSLSDLQSHIFFSDIIAKKFWGLNWNILEENINLMKI